jgi:hypothetical protein
LPALCDVNLLIALVTDRHQHHAAAAQWLESAPTGEAVICRIAQMGLLRLLNNPAVMGDEALDTDSCWELWRRLLEDERIQFVPSEPDGLDTIFREYTSKRAFSPRLWTDAYLAAYARAGGLTLVTFDSGLLSYKGLTCQVLRPADPPA